MLPGKIKTPARLRDGRRFPRYHPYWSQLRPTSSDDSNAIGSQTNAWVAFCATRSITFTQTAPEGTSLKHGQVGSQSAPNTSLLVPIQLLSSFNAFNLVPPIIGNCDVLSRPSNDLYPQHRTNVLPLRGGGLPPWQSAFDDFSWIS